MQIRTMGCDKLRGCRVGKVGKYIVFLCDDGLGKKITRFPSSLTIIRIKRHGAHEEANGEGRKLCVL